MTKIYVISDTHFGHENMYKFTRLDGITRVRPEFSCAADADRAMVERWNAVVTPEDHVWHLGDLTMKRDADQLRETVLLIQSLKGHKRLILGNHDHFDVRAYRNMGFQKVMACRYIDGIWLTHIPVHPDGLYGGRINAHGHIHERHIMLHEADASGLIGKRDPRYVNVAVEQTNYTPILLEEVRQRHQAMVAGG